MNILVFTATYNELGNIERLCKEVLASSDQITMLVVDDSSPDGTGELLDRLAAESKRITIIHRPAKMGVGSAHRLALRYAKNNNVDMLITMDADFSHPPSDIRRFIDDRNKGDYLVASRYAHGGTTEYTGKRLFISKTANLLAKVLLGLKMSECTSSFRGFSREAISRLDSLEIVSEGYSYFLEVSYLAQRLEFNIFEFGFDFKDRSQGVSKISKREIFKAVRKVMSLAVNRFLPLNTVY